MRLSLLSSVMRSRSTSSGISAAGWPVDSTRLRSGSLRSADARRIMRAVDLNEFDRQ
jgi:hypothetical protein